ncbi:G-D-S-L family lipolytic protein [Flavobacterium ardleyense]|uniref:G-D-S-L family lipolytic protein n=1 Tax=Flavobacterium ardleyense TaxID=2038737 RepID=UPI00298C4C1D|nr:G-D-S-L family lipolytic protein [Flavobacterium ardleyense]
MIKNFKWLLFVSLAFVACDNNDLEDDVVQLAPLTAGSADFSKYVAVGNSLTSGFSDNALFRSGQENSFPNILAKQFAEVGGGEFKIPYTNDNLGGLLFMGNVIQPTRLYFNGVGPVNVAGTPTNEVTQKLTGPFNNMGVPGAKIFHLVAPGYGNPAGVPTGQANPYFARFASSNTATILGDAMAQAPTFFSLWIGNNDVLSYATSGGSGTNQLGNTDPSTYGGNDITDPQVFGAIYSSLVNGLIGSGGAKGVVANIPYVTSIPFFRTVPFNAVPLPEANAAQLNAGYAQYNGGLQQALGLGAITAEEAARRKIVFKAGQNAVVMVDSYLTDLSAFGIPSYRQATKDDLIILTARTFIGTTVGGNPALINGVSVPLADNWVLSKEEVAEVKVAVDSYNAIIKSIATEKNLAFVDVNKTLSALFASGLNYGNYNLTATYVTGGAFSLDGVHPGARGYAYMANKFAEAINAQYGSTLRGVDIGQYSALYPQNLP